MVESLRERIAHTIRESFDAWKMSYDTASDDGPSMPEFLADAVIAAGLTTPPGMTAQKLYDVADTMDALAEPYGFPTPLPKADWLRGWARVLDDPEAASGVPQPESETTAMSDEIGFGNLITDEPFLVHQPKLENPTIVVTVLPGGELDLPDGMTLDETIAALWAEHAKSPHLSSGSFIAAMALLEVRALAGRVSSGKEPRPQ